MFNIEMFQNVLQEQVRTKKLAGKTMDGYLRCIRQLEKECGNKEGPSAGNLEEALIKICSENKQMAKFITAIKKYERDMLASPKILLYGEPLARIRALQPKISQGKKLSNSEKTYSHKINGIHNKRLKLAFRLQKKSGLRVDEIANLRPEDIVLSDCDNSIMIHVQNGKGRKSRIVNVTQDEYLYNNLKARLSELEEGEKLFYSTSYLMKKAHEYGMETHDLRRINSRERFREEVADGSSRREARSAVARQLGHEDPKVTSLYLGGELKGGRSGDEQSET